MTMTETGEWCDVCGEAHDMMDCPDFQEPIAEGVECPVHGWQTVTKTTHFDGLLGASVSKKLTCGCASVTGPVF